MAVEWYKATDPQGNPLPGVQVSQKTAPGWCGENPVSGFADSQGIVSLDPGCPFGASGTWAASAPGYQSQSGTWNNNGFENKDNPVVITMRNTATADPSGNCPWGYTKDPTTGDCVKQSSPNYFANVMSWIKQNWLLLIVLLAAIAFIVLLFYNPSFFSGKLRISKAGVTATK